MSLHIPADKQSGPTQSSARPSSPGNSPVVVTPKDVAPDAATARDTTVRNVTSDNLEERQEALLDDAIELTFPASDPISIPSYDEARGKPHAKK